MTKNNSVDYSFSENNTFVSIIIGKFVVDIQLLHIDFKDEFLSLIEAIHFKKIFFLIENLIKDKDFNNHLYLSILLTDNKYIKETNKKFRKKSYPTNIISFPSNEYIYFKDKKSFISQHSLHFGDIIISIEKIFSEAKEENKNFKNHFFHILIHGLLHLLGYDHYDNKTANDMEKLEVSILNSIGIVNPY
tara:strand:- start:319 stop:888 length:570 start_codon:yes stop_codon:yes gene_type:complete